MLLAVEVGSVSGKGVVEVTMLGGSVISDDTAKFLGWKSRQCELRLQALIL